MAIRYKINLGVNMATLFQAGTLVSLLQGVNRGDVNFKSLAEKGDIGLGTVDGVDGEMIAVDGIYYRIDAQGVAHIIPPNTCTPFAVVTHFESDISFDLFQIDNIQELENLLDEKIKNTNVFYMIRMEVDVEWIKLRSMACQTRTMIPMAESLAQLQSTFEIHQSVGCLVGTRCPTYFQTLNVAGYHFHYIDQEKSTGGHVFDVKIKSAKVFIQTMRQCQIQLLETSDFDTANLDINIAEASKKVEKQR
jgi:acetolactate decarboxylase